ncbi:hypothetical protein [Hoyosella altamirensis]|uniref:ATP/GTP-binding protein n=1 Tax=Hoyosella altamirensis TaxID=616997 RepID=A0A839RIC7_9ACTN|nr:hypothetical protein [Hoyosella altamirensis]MBB3036180.1 hypothetical protein [Hoyosella altamirensis]
MPRRNIPRRRERGGSSARPPLSHAGVFSTRIERGDGFDPSAEYSVRDIPGAAAAKTYRCPGCDQIIPAGMPHVVAWRNMHGGEEDRRHWHKGCWNGRRTRTVTRRWS